MQKFNFKAYDNPNTLVYINTTPLIDVMLVLLIMIIITIPMNLHSVDLGVPKNGESPEVNLKDLTIVKIDSAGSIKIDNREILDRQDLRMVLTKVIKNNPKTRIFIDSHPKSNFENIALIMFEARKIGVNEIGFSE